jgi:GAF domain-containing protein
MNASVLRFLQQENIRLKKEAESLEKEKTNLLGYLDTAREVQDAMHLIPTAPQPLQLLSDLLRKIRQTVGANDGSISKLDPKTNELVFLLVQGELGGQLTGFRISGESGIAGWVVNHQEPIIVNSPRQDWRFSQVVDAEFSFFTWSIASAPILKDGKFLGVIQLLNKHLSDFSEADVTLMTMLGYTAGLVLDKIDWPNPPHRDHEELLFG